MEKEKKLDIKQKLKSYFEREADAIQLGYEHSSTTSHPSDVGSNRENLLVDFFEKHLPHKFHAVKGGKIFDSSGNFSKQVDVIIYDDIIPRLSSYEQTLYLAEGVATAIEVKPVLTKSELRVAIENLKSIKTLEKKEGGAIVMGDLRKDIYCGIFSFTTKMNFKQILTVIDEQVKSERVIDFIVVNNKHLILRNNGEWKMGCRERGEEIILFEDYLNFEDEKMVLYKFFMLVCREITRMKFVGSNGLEHYINMKFN